MRVLYNDKNVCVCNCTGFFPLGDLASKLCDSVERKKKKLSHFRPVSSSFSQNLPPFLPCRESLPNAVSERHMTLEMSRTLRGQNNEAFASVYLRQRQAGSCRIDRIGLVGLGISSFRLKGNNDHDQARRIWSRSQINGLMSPDCTVANELERVGVGWVQWTQNST